MRPGEVLVARLSGGASIVRFKEERNGRVAALLGKNKLARIPPSRVMLATGALVDPKRFEDFRSRAETAFRNIDLSEVWDALTDDQEAVSFQDIADLYWTDKPGPIELVSLLLALERTPDLFLRDDGRYRPRTRDDLAKLLKRRRREAEKARDTQALAESLSEGRLPDTPSRYQESLVEAMKGYAVNGEEFQRRSAARGLVDLARPEARDHQRACFEMLVSAGIFDADEPIELHRTGIRRDFPPQALDEASAMAGAVAARGGGREDLTGLDAVTIDDEETKDRDDALSLEALEGGYRLGVHISDCGALAPPGGEMDREADRRMASLYLPEGVIPMLPDAFTRGVGSLDPNQERAAISLVAELTGDGDVTNWKVAPSIIRSAAALSYDEVDRIIRTDGSRREMLNGLYHIAAALRRRRIEQGAIDIDQPEMTLRVRASGDIDVKTRDRSSPAHQIVAEMMILCNTLLAQFCYTEGLPAVYRSQGRPDTSNLPDTSRLDERAAPVIARHNLTRRMQPARVSTTPLRHGGLGVEAYLQATSPLRRYPDLVIQRQISSFLATGKPLYALEEVESVAQRAQLQIKELSQVEDIRKRYWFLKYLASSRMPPNGPDAFEAVALQNDGRRTALLELVEFPFRAKSKLPKDVPTGAVVTLRLRGVDLWRRSGSFVHVP